MVAASGKRVAFSSFERRWQRRWKESRIFEAAPGKKPKYFFTTPYPYISGSLHIGHGRAVVESDVYSRYLRMNGSNVLFPMAFHISGTPVIGISQSISQGDSAIISLYESYVSAYVKDKRKVESIVRSFKDPRAIVSFFIPRMIEEYQSLGVGIDWRRSFTSGDIIHQKLVEWQFGKYREQGYVSSGSYPVLYSSRDQSAMGEDDIRDADSDPVDKVEYTLIKFSLGKKFLVAATLRPETIFGVTNVWINPNASYVEAEVGKERWILTKEAFDKLTYQRKDIRFAGLTTESLIGSEVLVPLTGRSVLVLPSTFVDSHVATGVVMSVPADAPYDYVALLELQRSQSLISSYSLLQKKVEELEIIPIIKTPKYGDKSAVTVVESHGVVLHDDPKLEGLTREVYKEGYHSGIMLDICGEFAGLPVAQAKEAVKSRLSSQGLSGVFYETSRKAVSRSGNPIIVAVLDGQWFIDFNAPGWKEKANRLLSQITLVPASTKKLFEDTFAWLDKRPCARRRGLGTQLPFDTQWVIESLSDSTIYMVLYTFAHLVKKHRLGSAHMTPAFFDYVLLGKGSLTELSRALRIPQKVLSSCRSELAYWMPIDQRHTFMLHLSNHLSFMIFAFAGLLPESYWPKKVSFHGLVVREGVKMSKSKGNVITLLDMKQRYGADIYRFYMTSSTSLDGTFDWRDSEAERVRETLEKVYSILIEAVKKSKKGAVPALYVSRFNSILKIAEQHLGEMKLREYNLVAVYDMLRLIRDARTALSSVELGAFYFMIADAWIRLLAPVVPHLAEEVWFKAKKKGFVSIAQWPHANISLINIQLEAQEKVIDKAVEDIVNVLALVAQKGLEPSKVFVYTLPQERALFNEKLLTARVGKPVQVFGVNEKGKYDPQGKSSKAKPGKPAIYVE